MSLTPDLLNELDLLNLFDLSSTQGGIKIHQDAGDNKINAAQRLFDKGIISQTDGGYLTDRGVETAEHVQILVKMLQSES
ncbi:MAG: TIGR02647 family protein [Kangiella sp.]|nr:MAG: TIGR02647 family protein [Kangiella sp.]